MPATIKASLRVDARVDVSGGARNSDSAATLREYVPRVRCVNALIWQWCQGSAERVHGVLPDTVQARARDVQCALFCAVPDALAPSHGEAGAGKL